jgi:hypothetical protein
MKAIPLAQGEVALVTAGQINALYSELCALSKTSLEKAIEIGALLAQMKASMKHGEWLPWLKANIETPTKRQQNTNEICEVSDPFAAYLKPHELAKAERAAMRQLQRRERHPASE